MEQIISQKKLDQLFKWTIEGIEKNSTEAYFDKNKAPLSLCFLEMVKEIRIFYDDYLSLTEDVKNQKTILSKKIDVLKTTISKYEKRLAKIINAEVVVIGFEYAANAHCLTLWADKNMIQTKKNQYGKNEKQWNRDFEVRLEDVVETSNGFRFRKPKDIKIAITLGFGLFSRGLTDDEIVAFLLHEFGHTLQQLLVSASLNIYCEVKANILKSLLYSLDVFPFGYIFKAIFAKFNNPEKKAKKDKVDKNIANLLTDWKRDDLVKDEKKSSDHLLNQMKEESKDYQDYYEELKKDKKNPLTICIDLFKLCYHIIRLPFFLTIVGSKQNITYNINRKFIEKQIRFEQFADYMAAQYGYGADLARGLNKLSQDNRITHDFGYLNFVYYIPLINLIFSYYGYMDLKQQVYLYGYPVTNERISGIFQSLQYELNNNKDLSNEDKENIKADMEDLRKTYSEHIGKTGIRSLAYRIFCKITRKTIESPNSSGNIEKNVLEVFNSKDLKEK